MYDGDYDDSALFGVFAWKRSDPKRTVWELASSCLGFIGAAIGLAFLLALLPIIIAYRFLFGEPL